MDERNTLSILAEELGKLLAPLEDALSSPQNFTAFMRELGWNFQLIPSPLQALASPVRTIKQQVEQVASDPSKVQDLIGLLKSFFNLVDGLKDQAPGQFPPTIDVSEFKNDFPGQLVQFLVIEYLENEHPKVGYFLRTMGVIRESRVSAAGLRPAYRRRELAWNDLVQLLDAPLVLMKNAYNWGQSQFDVERLTLNLAGLFSTMELEFQLQRPHQSLFNFLTQGNIGLQPHHNWMLSLPLLQDRSSPLKTELGIGLYYLPEIASAKPGFALAPYARGNLSAELELTDTLTFILEAAANLNGGVAVVVRPEQDVRVVFDIITSGGAGVDLPKGGQFDIGFLNQKSEGEKILLLGSANGSRLEYVSASLTTGVQLSYTGETDLYGEVELKGSELVIQPGTDADSFLAELLPGDGFAVEVSLAVGLSSSQGFYFRGSGGLEIALPTHIQLGPTEVQSLVFAIKPGSDGIAIELGGTIRGNFGVLKAVVENIGLQGNFTFPSSGGNLGLADLDLGFKPPNGVGLSLDTPAVKGGGFLFIDAERGEYAGALELTFNDFIALKAIGLITTKMPDGSKGFSLLIIITAEFETGIQLGFGFTLLAVGGLLGLNRTMKLQPLMEGIRTGAVNSIMFPRDVIANAPKIISDLRAFFPPQEGTFLIGPMAKLGWGTPTLISISLGIIIEVPGNIAILGVLRVALPADEAAVLVLNVNFAGAIEFDKKRVYFFASLFESRILFITIEGEMGLLAAFGDDANFVVSVGGFHPRFNPPPLPIPSPRRVSVNLVNSPLARVRIEGYFAVTTNTVQFGALAELFFGLDDLNVEGHLGFDALFQFSPFYFVIEISASFSVKVFGAGLFSVRIRGSLEGPTPWRARGEGSISLLFWDISVPIDVTWGESRDTMLPPIAVMPLFEAEFKKTENWRALPPPGNNLLVALRKMPAEEAALVLHPVGVLRVTQRALPLELKLDKVGNQKPSDVNRLSVAATGGLSKKGDAFEQFAPAQFENLNDGEKLSRPAFEPEPAGLDLSAAGEDLRSSGMVKRIVRYEEVILDSNYKRFARRFFRFSATLFNLFLNGASVAKSDLSQAKKNQFQPFEEKIEVRAETFTVAYQSNNQAYAAGSTSFASESIARDFLAREAARDANLTETLHVIPDYERVL